MGRIINGTGNSVRCYGAKNFIEEYDIHRNNRERSIKTRIVNRDKTTEIVDRDNNSYRMESIKKGKISFTK